MGALKDKPWAAASNAIVPRVGHLKPDEFMRLAAAEGSGYEEIWIAMDESTLVDALEQRVRLQLQPIEARQKEMLDEFKSWRNKMQTLETQAALFDNRIERYEKDLNRGLSAIRKDLAEGMEEMEEKIKSRNKVLAPAFAALASVTAILLVLVIKWVLA